jgi:hypothetical protein
VGVFLARRRVQHLVGIDRCLVYILVRLYPRCPKGERGILYYLCPSVRPRYFSSHFCLPRYGVHIWSLWPNIRFLSSIVAEKNATKNVHIWIFWYTITCCISNENVNNIINHLMFWEILLLSHVGITLYLPQLSLLRVIITD